jgi:hypothetical protein
VVLRGELFDDAIARSGHELDLGVSRGRLGQQVVVMVAQVKVEERAQVGPLGGDGPVGVDRADALIWLPRQQSKNPNMIHRCWRHDNDSDRPRT